MTTSIVSGRQDYGTLLDAVAANAAEASRTQIINVVGQANCSLLAWITRVAASALTVTIAASLDDGTTYGDIQSMSVSGGTGTLSDMTWSKAVSADKGIIIDLPVAAYTHIKVIIGGTGGGATDKLTLQASAVSI